MDNLPMPDSFYNIRDKLLHRPARKPDIEFLVPISLEQCQARLSKLVNDEPPPHFLEKRLRGWTRGTDFYCYALWNVIVNIGSYTVFKGKLITTSHGVHITGQFRPSFAVMILEMIWLAMALFSLIQYPVQPFRAPFVFLCTSMIMWVILRLERRLKPYLAERLRQTLSDNS